MRLVDWSSRLDAVISDYRARGFEFGHADCLMFAAAAVHAVKGIDYGEALRGTYKDERGAARAILSLGAKDAPGVLNGLFEEIPISHASRGDLAVASEPTESDQFGAIGVVLGQIVAGYGDTGLNFLTLDRCSRAFKVD